MPSAVSGHDLMDLQSLVVASFNESNWRELGALTNTLDEVESHARLLRSLAWGDSDYRGLALSFLRKMIGSNDENLAIVKEYLADHRKRIGENVSSEQTGSRPIVFSPSVFGVPKEPVDSNLVSVMMPFRAEFNNVYDTIRSASDANGLRCKRADDIWEHSVVMQDVFSLIFRSYIVVCDFSDRNPNVFYEAGIAHTLGKHVVPITQSPSDIPFDLQQYRYLRYHNNSEGMAELFTELASRIGALCLNRSYPLI